LSSHDYENLALININRSAIAKGMAHWRTYSDMADNKVSRNLQLRRF
jgi:hypothetical protein